MFISTAADRILYIAQAITAIALYDIDSVINTVIVMSY